MDPMLWIPFPKPHFLFPLYLSVSGVVLDLEWFICHSWGFVAPNLTAGMMPAGLFLTFIIDASNHFHIIQS